MIPGKSGGGLGRVGQIIQCVVIAGVLLLGSGIPVCAATGDELAKVADKLVRDAERNMFNGKIDDAVRLLKEAEEKIAELKQADPTHRRLASIETKYSNVKKQIDRKVSQRASTATRSATVSPAARSSSGGGGEKLPAGVSKRLRDIESFLNTADEHVSSDAEKARYKLNQADALFGEIDRMYGSQFNADHPDFEATKKRYVELMAKVDARAASEARAAAGAADAKAAMEQQSAEWVARFRPYLSYPGQEGHDPDRVVFVPGTSEPEKFEEAQRRYEDFKAFYAEYRKTDFPNGKTWQLEELGDREAPQRLEMFESQFADRISSVSGDADRQITDAIAQLDRDNGWKRDKNVKPPIIDSKWMASIQENVARAAEALGNDPKASAIRKRFAELVAKDKANRNICAERTFLSPDVYGGSDAGDLKKKAIAIVEKEKPGSRILRVSLYKDNWIEETVEEWTDSTRTKWRVRTTRKINVQVAAKDAAGVYLHTLHVAKDKQSGGWGSLYGHIMFSDPMLEENAD